MRQGKNNRLGRPPGKRWIISHIEMAALVSKKLKRHYSRQYICDVRNGCRQSATVWNAVKAIEREYRESRKKTASLAVGECNCPSKQQMVGVR